MIITSASHTDITATKTGSFFSTENNKQHTVKLTREEFSSWPLSEFFAKFAKKELNLLARQAFCSVFAVRV